MPYFRSTPYSIIIRGLVHGDTGEECQCYISYLQTICILRCILYAVREHIILQGGLLCNDLTLGKRLCRVMHCHTCVSVPVDCIV